MRVTAYGRAALDALRDIVAEVKRHDAMAPVTVLVPNNIAGIVARRHLAHGLTAGGNGVAGIWFTTLPRLAEQLATPSLTAKGRRPATRTVTAAAIRERLTQAPGDFAPVAAHPSTARALAQAFRELRDVDEATLDQIGEASSLTDDVVRLHRETWSTLATGYYDTTDLLIAATSLVRDDAVTAASLGDIVLYLPQDPSRAETAFTDALGERTTMHLIVGSTGSERADASPFAASGALGAQRDLLAAEPLAARVLTASDSDDEVRCVVREIVQALRHIPAHRVAVLYAGRSPYARLFHEHLGAAGITVNGPGVRPVNERAMARLVLGLLEVWRTGYRRADVMRTLGELSLNDFTGARISVPRWERVSREAGVVAGDDWDVRLTTFVEHQRTKAEREDSFESTRQRATRDRETAESLRTFMCELQSRFTAAEALANWAALGDWAADLLGTLVPAKARERMPLEEQYATVVLDRALAGLAVLDEGPSAPTVGGLEDALALEFESALPRVGRFGEGVLVAPITHAIGLDLDIVYVVGVSEDLYPGRLREDSLLPERVRQCSDGQLSSTRATFDLKHRALLAAFQLANEITVSFPRGDLRRHTHRLPSRWLLPTLRQLSGDPNLAATEYEKISGSWIEESPSFAGSVLSTDTPSTEQEWRLHSATAGAPLDDNVVQGARAMVEGRESASFTRFDGNLAGAEDLPDLLAGTAVISPTALERYAICPHEYFVRQMLRVEPVEDPEELVEISVMDVGNLIHESFDALVREVGDADELPGFGVPWSEAQRDRLLSIGAQLADEYEAAGKTGHPLLWARARENIFSTLDWMVDDDNAWRAEQDARVVASELAFGLRGEPTLGVPVAGGTVQFRGAADKIDQRRDGTLLVTDIKSGSARTFKDLSESNPDARGEKLQLPVYAHAARAAYGDEDTPVEALYWFVRRDRGRVQVPLTDVVEQRYAATVGALAASLASGAFPQRAPEKPDFRWVQCPYCNPDGLGHAAPRRRWEAKRLSPELVGFTSLVEPDVLPDHSGDGEAQT